MSQACLCLKCFPFNRSIRQSIRVNIGVRDNDMRNVLLIFVEEVGYVFCVVVHVFIYALPNKTANFKPFIWLRINTAKELTMRYKDIRPAKAADITKITPQQLAAQDAQSLPVKSERQLRGELQRKMALDIAADAQKQTAPTNFDKAMAFRRYSIAKTAADKAAEQQQAKAQQWVNNGKARRDRE